MKTLPERKVPVLMRIALWSAAAVLLAAPTLVAAPAKEAPPTLCTKEERTYFSCGTGKKVVAICARGRGEAIALQYRFGKPDKVEMQVPAAPTKASEAAKGQSVMFSGGGGFWLRFTNGDTSYVVYSGIGKGWMADGVAVEAKGKKPVRIKCTTPPHTDAFPELDGEFIDRLGIEEDGSDFDISGG